MKCWNRFETVLGMPTFAGDWRETSCAPLPDGIGLGELTQKNNPTGLRCGIPVSFQSGGCSSEVEVEAVNYLPHGNLFEDLGLIASTSLPLLLLKSKYWIGTHDEPKEKFGFTVWYLSEYWLTLEESCQDLCGEAW